MTYYIYSIINKKTDIAYYGSTKDFENRWIEHRNALRENRHGCKKLQYAWNIYGENNFDYMLVEICSSEDEVSKREKEIIYNSWPNKCYNARRSGNRPIGHQHGISEDTQIRMSMAQTLRSEQGRMHKLTDEQRKRVGERQKQHPEFYKAMLASVSESNKYRIISEETREKMRASHKARWQRRKENGSF